MDFENKIDIGIGFYTPSDISSILRLPYHKVKRWIDKYWDGELGREYCSNYSWKVDGSQAVSFHTLVEFYVLVQFGEAGVRTRKVLNAHKELSQWYSTPFPFAHRDVLKKLRTDGLTIYLLYKGNKVSLDGTKQLNFDFLRLFFKKLDFDSDQLATRLWPLGKEKSVLIDPKRKFGQPILKNHNIYPETLYNLYKGGDSIEYISYLYEIDADSVKDAIEYSEAA